MSHNQMPKYNLEKGPDGKLLLTRTSREEPKKNANSENQFCMFCKKKELSDYFHSIKECTVLKSNICMHCNTPGHTRKYCPEYDNSEYTLDEKKNKYIYKNNLSDSDNSNLDDSIVPTDTTNVLDELNENIKSDSSIINLYCDFCEKNGVPKNICKNHNMFTNSNGDLVLSCPLYYYLNKMKESNNEDTANDKILTCKISKEPIISPRYKKLNLEKIDFISKPTSKNILNCSIESINTDESGLTSDDSDNFCEIYNKLDTHEQKISELNKEHHINHNSQLNPNPYPNFYPNFLSPYPYYSYPNPYFYQNFNPNPQTYQYYQNSNSNTNQIPNTNIFNLNQNV